MVCGQFSSNECIHTSAAYSRDYCHRDMQLSATYNHAPAFSFHQTQWPHSKWKCCLLSRLCPGSLKSYYLIWAKIMLERELTVLDFTWICALDLNSLVSSKSRNSRMFVNYSLSGHILLWKNKNAEWQRWKQDKVAYSPWLPLRALLLKQKIITYNRQESKVLTCFTGMPSGNPFSPTQYHRITES